MASATQHDGLELAVIDSGLGGISVARALRVQAPGLALLYAADTAGFPYGDREANDITARGLATIEALRALYPVRHVVLACNTLSTLSLATLRSAFSDITFTGTVPAIKVAASQSHTRRFTLLATPNTAHSSYSQALIDEFAKNCVVDCYGAPKLARMAEETLLGEKFSADAWRGELMPAFHDDKKGKTDQVILGCTHYPLILDQLRAHAPWPVSWIDSGEAIARQTLRAAEVKSGPSHAYVTNANNMARYVKLFAAEGFTDTSTLSLAMDARPAASFA